MPVIPTFDPNVASAVTPRVPVTVAFPPTDRASATFRLPAEPSAAGVIATSPFRVVSPSTLNSAVVAL